MFEGLVDWVTRIVETVGYGGVAGLVALENLFPPIPSEVILPLSGFVAGRGDASIVGMVVAATIGSMIGAILLYGIAAGVGPARLRRFVVRFGGWFGLDETDLDKTEEWFDRRATVAVLLCRCVPLMRSLISIPAGFRRMPLGRFSIYTLIGSLVWNVALISGGYLLGDRWDQLEDPLEAFQRVVVGVIFVAVAWFVWRRIIRPRVRKA